MMNKSTINEDKQCFTKYYHTSIPDPVRSSRVFDKVLFQNKLTTRCLGRTLMYTRHSVDSTMQVARRFIDSGTLPHYDDLCGTLFLAEQQSHGRGREQREWASMGEYENLYATLVLVPRDFVELCKLNLSIGLAVCMACHDVGVVDARVKWPNDVWVNGQKVSGMLIDSMSSVAEKGESVIIALLGVGINVNQDMSQHPNEEVRRVSCSLYDALRKKQTSAAAAAVSRETLLACVMNHLETLLAEPMESILKIYEQWDIIMQQSASREIIVMPKKRENPERRLAVAMGYSPFGNLKVVFRDDPLQRVVELIAEEVSVRSLALQ